MSTLTDKAKAEADEAEANEPNEEEEEAEAAEPAQPEPEPEPPAASAPPAMTEQEAEREFNKLERLAQTYLTKAMPLTEKLGLPVQACPMCTFPGLALPRQAHEVTSDVEAAIFALIGKNVEPDYKESQAYRRCEACDGWGDVLTGARKDVSRTAMCIACGGKGFLNVVTPAPAAPPTGASGFPGAQVSYTPLPAGIADQWGRPAGHPHWGLDPALVGSPNGQQVG